MSISRLVIAFAVLLTLVSPGAHAEAGLPPILSAPEARQAQLEGRILLVDIRSPGEWRKTGVAAGALTITVHRRDFALSTTSMINWMLCWIVLIALTSIVNLSMGLLFRCIQALTVKQP
jgi:hypothetical protein